MPDPAEVVTAPPIADTFEAYEAMRKGEAPKVIESAATETEAKTDEVSEASETEQEESRERDEVTGKFKSKKSDVPEGVQKRIDKLTAQRREAERERDEVRRQLEEARATKPAETPKAETKSADKPTPDKFPTYEEYVEALTDWKTDQKLAKASEAAAIEAKKRTEGERQKTVAEAWKASEAAAREKFSDYEDVIQEAAEAIKAGELPAVNNDVFAAIMESDSKAEVMYHLAKNVEDLKRLTSATTHTRMILELGKIEAKLAAPVQDKEPKAVAKAPRPPTPVGNRASSSVSRESAKSFEEYEAARNAKLGRR